MAPADFGRSLSSPLMAFKKLRPFENFSILNLSARYLEKYLSKGFDSLPVDWK